MRVFSVGYFHLTKIPKIDVQLINDQHVEARNSVGEKNLIAFGTCWFTFCHEIKKKILTSGCEVLRIIWKWSQSIHEWEKEQKKQVNSIRAAAKGDKHDQNHMWNYLAASFFSILSGLAAALIELTCIFCSFSHSWMLWDHFQIIRKTSHSLVKILFFYLMTEC